MNRFRCLARCAAQYWVGWMVLKSGDVAGALDYFAAVCDGIGGRQPSRVLADCLDGRAWTLLNLDRVAEAAQDARRELALSRELGYPAGEAGVLECLSMAAYADGDLGGAVRLGRQAEQIASGIPGSGVARGVQFNLTELLTEAGDLTAAERVCAAGLAECREGATRGTWQRCWRG